MEREGHYVNVYHRALPCDKLDREVLLVYDDHRMRLKNSAVRTQVLPDRLYTVLRRTRSLGNA